MNRYKMTPSPTAKGHQDLRLFMDAWSKIASIYHFLDTIWPQSIRQASQFIPDDEISIIGGESDFFPNSDDPDYFHLQVQFHITDISIGPNPPKYSFSLYVREILTEDPVKLQNSIYDLCVKKRQEWISDHLPKPSPLKEDSDWDRKYSGIPGKMPENPRDELDSWKQAIKDLQKEGWNESPHTHKDWL